MKLETGVAGIAGLAAENTLQAIDAEWHAHGRADAGRRERVERYGGWCAEQSVFDGCLVDLPREDLDCRQLRIRDNRREIQVHVRRSVNGPAAAFGALISTDQSHPVIARERSHASRAAVQKCLSVAVRKTRDEA